MLTTHPCSGHRLVRGKLRLLVLPIRNLFYNKVLVIILQLSDRFHDVIQRSMTGLLLGPLVIQAWVESQTPLRDGSHVHVLEVHILIQPRHLCPQKHDIEVYTVACEARLFWLDFEGFHELKYLSLSILHSDLTLCTLLSEP